MPNWGQPCFGALTRYPDNIKRCSTNPIVQVDPHTRAWFSWELFHLNPWLRNIVLPSEYRAQLVAELKESSVSN
jgi:hypothetical protein